jgi:sigma-B regulation protein RsbU (phosphoserine phosphatase)
VLSRLDREFPFTRFDKFFTISYLVINASDGILRYSNAAHPPPVLLHRDGSFELLREGGTIIGMGGMLRFEEGEKQLKSGDKLFLYTDGVIEYRNGRGNFYGEERFYGELQRLKDQPVSTIIEGVIDSMMKFGDNTEPQDDVSLLGLEFKGDKE